MKPQEAIVMGMISENMANIHRLAGLLNENIVMEIVERLDRYHLPVTFPDFNLMRNVVISVAEAHGHTEIRTLVDEIQAIVGG